VNRRPSIRSLKAPLLIAVALACAGCYRYVPAQMEATPPGEGVRVLITRAGAAELATVTQIGGDAPVVDGTVLGVEGNELLLSVPVAQRQEGFITSALRQTIRVPTGEVVSFQRREFNSLATALTIGAAAGVVTAIVFVIADPVRGDIPDPPDPPDDLFQRFSLFSIPIGE
jgi:hypothetical protein